MRQRPVLRVCAELALVGIIRDSPTRSGGEWVMKVIRELVCLLPLHVYRSLHYVQLSNDPTLSSLPLLSTFLKSYSRPYLGIHSLVASKQISATSEPGTLSEETTKIANKTVFNSTTTREEDELVEKELRDRFKKMCEGYFDNVCKKLVIEHNVSLNVCSSNIGRFTNVSCSGCKSRIGRIMRRTSDQARFLKTGSKRTRK